MTLALRLIWLAALAAGIVGSVSSSQSSTLRLIDRAGINEQGGALHRLAIVATLPTLERFQCHLVPQLLAEGPGYQLCPAVPEAP